MVEVIGKIGKSATLERPTAAGSHSQSNLWPVSSKA